MKIYPSTESSCFTLEKDFFSHAIGVLGKITGFVFLVTCLLPFEILLAKDLPQTAGWIEEVMISPGNLRLQAKLDTGANSSSIHAENISSFTQKGETWVRFDLVNGEGKPVTLERKVHRTVKIKRHKQKSSERPVVLLGICVGDHLEKTEVNLSDRSNYKYPVLIGRMFLSGAFMVDPSSKHLLELSCRIETAAK